ncbi:MAG: hypothetical protein ACRDQV_17590, partial [Pseudonocardiaceae bacterium]
ARLGMAFKARPLRAAAEACLEFGAKWAELDPAALVTEVQNVPRVGAWTAGATVADLTNDYTLYPFADLSVRTWAKRLTPQCCWPDTEPEFAQAWARLAGDQLSDWTLLTLAWGVRHASTTATVAHDVDRSDPAHPGQRRAIGQCWTPGAGHQRPAVRGPSFPDPTPAPGGRAMGGQHGRGAGLPV